MWLFDYQYHLPSSFGLMTGLLPCRISKGDPEPLPGTDTLSPDALGLNFSL